MIEFGDADIVLAGASEASLSDFIMAGFKKMGVLAQPCSHNETIFKPYDKNRSGFVIGEGAGVVVLESMDHAKKEMPLCMGTLRRELCQMMLIISHHLIAMHGRLRILFEKLCMSQHWVL